MGIKINKSEFAAFVWKSCNLLQRDPNRTAGEGKPSSLPSQRQLKKKQFASWWTKSQQVMGLRNRFSLQEEEEEE